MTPFDPAEGQRLLDAYDQASTSAEYDDGMNAVTTWLWDNADRLIAAAHENQQLREFYEAWNENSQVRGQGLSMRESDRIMDRFTRALRNVEAALAAVPGRDNT